MLGLLEGLGIVGVILLVMLVLLVPFIVTIIVGVGFANLLGLTGIYWWAFVILFYIIIGAILGAIGA